jgi:predicted transcriptional regulator YheO
MDTDKTTGGFVGVPVRTLEEKVVGVLKKNGLYDGKTAVVVITHPDLLSLSDQRVVAYLKPKGDGQYIFLELSEKNLPTN